jgi:paraquat-inducible protein B
MTMSDTQGPGIPEAVAEPKPRWRVQIVWLIPLVALLIGGWLAVRAVMQHGPTITVIFKTAEGLEAGKTKFKYKDVDIGLVKAISVSRDLEHVIVTAELVGETKPHLVEDTRFWVVRPRIAGGSVSGLATLLAGSYIAVDRGTSNQPRREFVGLDEPPVLQRGRPGREYVLHSGNAGSLGVGLPGDGNQARRGRPVRHDQHFHRCAIYEVCECKQPVLERKRGRHQARCERHQYRYPIPGIDPDWRHRLRYTR